MGCQQRLGLSKIGRMLDILPVPEPHNGLGKKV